MHVALVKFLYNDALVLISQCKLILGCNSSMLKTTLSLSHSLAAYTDKHRVVCYTR